jgi:signal transduction histidine kinase
MRKLLFKFSFIFLIFWSEIGIAKEIKLPSRENMLSMEINALFALATEVSVDDIDAARSIIDVAFIKARSNKNSTELVDCYRSMGYIYEDHGMYASACVEYQKALDVDNFPIFQKLSVYNDIAIAYRKAKNYQKAKEFHLKAVEVAKANNELEMVEFGYDGLGTLYYIAGDYDKAADYYLQSLTCSEKRNKPINMIITLKNLAEIYTAAKHNDMALQSVEKAYQLAVKQKDKEASTKVMICYANTLCEIGRYDDAVSKITESLKMVENDTSLVAAKVDTYLSLGDIYYKQHNFVKAGECFNYCLKEKGSLSGFNLAKLYIDLGDICLAQHDMKNAELQYNRGLTLAQDYQLLPLIQKAHQGLYELYKQKKEMTGALHHLELANTLRDSLNSEEKIKRIAELQFRYDLNRSEKEIQELRFRENKLTLIGGLGITSVMILLLIFVIWMRGQNNKSLVFKNKEIEQQNKRLAESNEILRQFAYASAHDLKEPLRNIGSFVTLIQRRFGKDLPAECNEYMGYVTTGVTKMNNLLVDLLAYSTLIMNKDQEYESAVLSDVVKDIKQNLQSTIETKNATIVCTDNVPLVSMSKLHTTQLLQNLISNGIKFVNEKTPIITIESKDTENNNVLITVEDNGIGIKKEYSEKVFHLFQRLHKNDLRYEGTGVGLAICKNIVEKYNGQIWFESVENQGTKFFIQLPKAA